jgi:hypothetical protein
MAARKVHPSGGGQWADPGDRNLGQISSADPLPRPIANPSEIILKRAKSLLFAQTSGAPQWESAVGKHLKSSFVSTTIIDRL